MGTSNKIIADGDTEVLCTMDLLENCATQLVQFGYWGIASVDAHDIAFGRIEAHSPFRCPCAKFVQISLEGSLIALGLNPSVCQTVISKQTGYGSR